MSDNSNKKDKKLDLNKVEEPAAEYSTEKTYVNIEDHPLFAKVIEKSKKDLKEGKGIPHEVVMKNIKEKYPFLK
ncbi:hypothetical protein [Flavobacterium sp.]|uniref:hypothetical protein n=1 Tax=Flavobacterium sp. TaxID=239 RepID=UPI000EE9EE92|nr:hypothetical protein [Flavobacterium sp.]HCQ13624.1 hypothetical protein [Flavobacterium sp.]